MVNHFNSSLENLDARIQKVIQSDTDDFFELAKILGRDPLQDLEGANLRGTNLEGCKLCGANFRKTSFREANLKNADLSGVNLKEADLTNADLSGANLKEADLTNADLSGSNLSNVNFNGAILDQANLSNAILSGSTLESAINQASESVPIIKQSSKLVPIILAGGKGERFWPVSRLKNPKQFLCLDGSGRSLMQSTADRLLPLAGGWESIWVITASHLADGVKQQLPELPEENILVEPQGRDTAPAVAWATLEVAKRHGDDAIACFFPADHYITDEPKFRATIRAAADLAQNQGAIVTLGIQPTFPSTSYGYIEQGDDAGKYSELAAYRVSRFTEKPERSVAEEFLASGRYNWNSGMFIFPAGVMTDELKTYAPELMGPLLAKGVDAYAELEKLSIDYAVMEKTKKAYVIPANFGWDDLGDWNAIERLMKGEDANVDMCQHQAHDSNGCIVYSSDEEEVVVTIGLEDVVVVRDGNATLIVKKDRTQEIKKAVKALGKEDKFLHLL